jgi:hypothetical protein
MARGIRKHPFFTACSICQRVEVGDAPAPLPAPLPRDGGAICDRALSRGPVIRRLAAGHLHGVSTRCVRIDFAAFMHAVVCTSGTGMLISGPQKLSQCLAVGHCKAHRPRLPRPHASPLLLSVVVALATFPAGLLAAATTQRRGRSLLLGERFQKLSYQVPPLCISHTRSCGRKAPPQPGPLPRTHRQLRVRAPTPLGWAARVHGWKPAVVRVSHCWAGPPSRALPACGRLQVLLRRPASPGTPFVNGDPASRTRSCLSTRHGPQESCNCYGPVVLLAILAPSP